MGSIDYDESGGVIFSGTSELQGRIRVFANNTAIGEQSVDASGRWFYRGSSIDRARMVALFSTILRREEGGYFLVTPHEKLRIEVEDAPCVVQLLEVSGTGDQQDLQFTDNAGNRFTVDREHKLWVEHSDDESRPYCIVRNNLTALLARPVYYQLADLITEVDSRSGVYSSGVFFPLD